MGCRDRPLVAPASIREKGALCVSVAVGSDMHLTISTGARGAGFPC